VNLSPHFTLAELTRTSRPIANAPSGGETLALTALCVEVLEPIRALLGVPIRINSGFRSAAVNAAIGGAKGSQHMKGEAADIVPVGMAVEAAIAKIAASAIPFDQLIVYPKGGFLHVSHKVSGAQRRQLLRSAAASGSGGPYSAWKP